jgi:hypothetical protein
LTRDDEQVHFKLSLRKKGRAYRHATLLSPRSLNIWLAFDYRRFSYPPPNFLSLKMYSRRVTHYALILLFLVLKYSHALPIDGILNSLFDPLSNFLLGTTYPSSSGINSYSGGSNPYPGGGRTAPDGTNPYTSSNFSSGSGNPNFPNPNVDPFYHPPDTLIAYLNGGVIRTRPANVSITVPGATANQILFKTTDTHDKPIGAVATVWKPANASFPPKIFGWQYAEDADNLDCAPSWAWITNSGSNSQPWERLGIGPVLIPWALNQGYYVVSTDAEGLDSAFLTGLTEARAVLDALRATISFQGLQTSQTTIALQGYSGGAHTTVWAVSQAESHAPELKIAGAAFGGTPIDLMSNFEAVNNGTNSLLVGAGIFGLANGHLELNATLNTILTDRGRQIAADFRAPNNCTQPRNRWTFPIFNYEEIFTQNIFTNPVVVNVLREESLLMNVSNRMVPVPKIPRYQYHGTRDITVPYGAEAEYVSQQCSKGANIQFTSFTGLDHGQALLAGFIGALQFVQQSFSGTTPNISCGTNGTSPSIFSSEATTVLGPQLQAQASRMSMFILATKQQGT